MFEIYDVYVSGKEGYHTYRIPSLIRTNKGTLLAFAEGRARRADVSEIDIVVKRSTDEGKTWDSPKIVAEDGKSSYANPCAIVLHNCDRIFLILQHYPYPCREKDVVPGFIGPEVCRNFVFYSDDDGITWSEPKDITETTKRPAPVTSIAGGPGIGIQLKHGEHKGRIVIPFNQGPYHSWKNYMIYSDDNGENWQMGNIIPDGKKGMNGNEIQIVELNDGGILANTRSYGRVGLFKKKSRRISISSDGGVNWSPFVEQKQLSEPRCQGSIISGNIPSLSSKDCLLFSNPSSQKLRRNGTIKISIDDGKSWQYNKVLCSGKFAYSCLCQINETEFGCLFETGSIDAYEKLSLAKFDIDWLSS